MIDIDLYFYMGVGEYKCEVGCSVCFRYYEVLIKSRFVNVVFFKCDYCYFFFLFVVFVFIVFLDIFYGWFCFIVLVYVWFCVRSKYYCYYCCFIF